MEMTWSTITRPLISGNTLFNNVVSLVPETGQDAYYVPGVERFPAYLQLTEDNVSKQLFRSSAAG